MNKDKYPMPWGKYKGSDIYFLPSAYLYWLAEKGEDLGLYKCKEIAKIADEEWNYREKYNCHRGKPKYEYRG